MPPVTTKNAHNRQSRRSRSPSPLPVVSSKKKGQKRPSSTVSATEPSKKQLKRSKNQSEANNLAENIEPMTEEEQQMAKLLGFTAFGSTKDTKVPGADVSAADIIVVPKYRQYMNKKRHNVEMHS